MLGGDGPYTWPATETGGNALTLNLYLKAIIAAAVPLVAGLYEWSQSGTLNVPEVSLAALAVANAILVYALRNRPTGVLAWSKALVAAANPVVVAVLTAWYTGAWNTVEWSTLLLGLATAVLVALSANNTGGGVGGAGGVGRAVRDRGDRTT